MTSRTVASRAVLLPLIAVAVASCTVIRGTSWMTLNPQSPGPGHTMLVYGTVHRLDVEGGVFVIRDEQGTQYNPNNLPDSLKVDGAEIEAVVRRRDHVATATMVGPPVDVIRIRRMNR